MLIESFPDKELFEEDYVFYLFEKLKEEKVNLTNDFLDSNF